MQVSSGNNCVCRKCDDLALRGGRLVVAMGRAAKALRALEGAERGIFERRNRVHLHIFDVFIWDKMIPQDLGAQSNCG